MNQQKKKVKKVVATTSRRKRSSGKPAPKKLPMLFGRENFKWMLIGVAFIALGLILMMGGSMPSPDVWDESIIYSHRRITLAPFLILVGLCIQIYAIFKKTPKTETEQ